MQVLAAIVALCAGASIAGASDLTVSARPSFDGITQPGLATAIAVDVDNAGADWKGKLEYDGEDMRREMDLAIPAAGHKRIWQVVRYERQFGEHQIALRGQNGEATVARFSTRPVGNRDAPLALLSDESIAAGALGHASSPFGGGNVVISNVRTADMPGHPLAYSALRAVFGARWQTSAMQTEQIRALDAWISLGGLFVVSADPNLARLREPWLAAMLPAETGGDERLGVLEALKRQSGVSGDFRGSTPWSVGLSPKPGARVLLKAGDVPLVVCMRRGAGAVCELGFDIGDPAVASFDGWSAFALELMGLYSRGGSRSSEERRAGDQPMAQIIEEGLGRAIVPSSNAGGGVLLFSGFYAFVLLPGNFLLFRKRNRPDDAWIGMLATTLVFGLGAWAMGLSRQRTATTSGLYVVRAAPSQKEGSVTGWIGAFSGARRSRSLASAPEIESASEIRFGAMGGMPPGAVPEDPIRLSGAGESTSLRVAMEAGSMRFFRVEGRKALADGMVASWTFQGTEPAIAWENGTGLAFDRLFIAGPGSGSAFETIARSVSAGSKGVLPASGKALPILTAAGDDLDATQAKLLSTDLDAGRRDCPGCFFLVGLPSAPSSPDGARWAYVWAVPPGETRPSPPARSFYVDLEPFRGGWSLNNDRLWLNSGRVIMDVPLADGFSAAGSAALKLRGSWTVPPVVEVFDRDKGVWVQEAGAAATGAEGETTFPPVAQARFSPGGAGVPVAALISRAGAVSIVTFENGRPTRSSLNFVADPAFPPAVAVDGLNQAHIVYRTRAGVLTHARLSAGRWTATPVPDSRGAAAAALSADGGAMNLVFVSPVKGFVYGSWDGARWTTSVISPDLSSREPVSVIATPWGRVACDAPGGSLDCWSWSGGAWSRVPLSRTTGSSARSISLLSEAGRISGVVLTDAAMGSMQVERLYGFATGRGAGGMRWNRGVAPLSSDRLAAVSMSGSSGYGGIAWTSGLTESGNVVLSGPYGGQTTDIRNAKPPFSFSSDAVGGAYWLFANEKGLVVKHDKGRLATPGAAYSGRFGGGTQERDALFSDARRFVWNEARVGRVRLTAQGQSSIENLVWQDRP